ncbi:hypothetical protein [Bradyrhizobium cenepequi]|uniref:hypothetical protein n=1 Tax=Bradyrhizobium cenepequi TaxID=2821403 RepID=UPI001CE324CA|nr:hypothetical protein [Bradyrhizobium cenepequi]MCA6111584.1 hypothetical protein [Bradyrhizobium cenepequi]
MKDMTEALERLSMEAEDCALISKPATDPIKRELFARLSDQLRKMATELRVAIKAKAARDEPTAPD